MSDHPIFKLNMTADSVVFIVNHTRRDYIHATKIIGIEDDGMIVQWYLQDATLTMARKNGPYHIIEVESAYSKKKYDAVEEVDPQPYLDKRNRQMGLDKVIVHGKTNGKKAG
jgi:hypothetical protein